MADTGMGRNRDARNRDLERYVKRDARGYVRYKHPKMDKPQHFGKDVARANEVARIVNAKLADSAQVIERILTPRRPSHSLATVIQRFIADHIRTLEWSANYQQQNISRLNTLSDSDGSRDFSSLTVTDLNRMIDANFSGDGRRLARNVLIHVYRYAIGRGLHQGLNEAERVLEYGKSERVRHRIGSLADLMTIRAHAIEVVQDAIDISLITLQARTELCKMRLADDDGSKLTVIRQKTAGEHKSSKRKKQDDHEDKAYIKMDIGKDLRQVLHRCKVKAVRYGSPYMLNHPSKLKSKFKTHRTQVLPGFLSNAFTDAVNACGLYDHLKPEERPTLHEVRSLGGRIYDAMGRPKEFIQSLYGHADIDMTEHYLDDGKIVWSMASADMDLSVAAATKLRE